MHSVRKLAPYLWGAVVLALFQLAWVFLTRYESDRKLERTISERSQRIAAGSTPMSTGTTPRIPWFYANLGEIVRGQQAVLCYGVENAVSVRIEPPVESLSPSFNRCFAVLPSTSTDYTLVAQGRTGDTQKVSLRVEVKPPPPAILFVSLSEKEIRRGQPWTFCYGVRGATSVQLDPLGLKLTPVEKKCLRLYPVRTTDFTLVATDELGRSDRECFTLTVR